jgi:hypothetical protein
MTRGGPNYWRKQMVYQEENNNINTNAPAYGLRKQVIGDLMAKFVGFQRAYYARDMDAVLIFSLGLLCSVFITIWLQELSTPVPF